LRFSCSAVESSSGGERQPASGTAVEDFLLNFFAALTLLAHERTAGLVSDAVQGLGGLDIVVCNAGRQQSKPSILDITSEDFDATMKTNIYAPFWIIKAALPHLAPGSCIIGTTSEQAYDPSPDLYDYAQTKAATMNYVKSLAKQLGSKGIRVNGVAPGPIWTPLQISGGAPEEKYEKFGSTTVLGRPGQPAELASIYVQLAADDASFATGNIYGSGGGQGQP
jgi:NAD(P)-dependent dehydrogenase (short-subunit alcohol dehydrogenase family)